MPPQAEAAQRTMKASLRLYFVFSSPKGLTGKLSGLKCKLSPEGHKFRAVFFFHMDSEAETGTLLDVFFFVVINLNFEFGYFRFMNLKQEEYNRCLR